MLSVLMVGGGSSRQLKLRADPRFSTAAPGGFASATFDLDEPITLDEPALREHSRVVVSDPRTAETVYEGVLNNPGRTRSPDGHVWEISAFGPAQLMADRSLPYVTIDGQLESWKVKDRSAPSATASVSADPLTGNDALVMQFPPGAPIGSGSTVGMTYGLLRQCGQDLGGMSFVRRGGITSADFLVQVVVTEEGANQQIPRELTSQKAGDTVAINVEGANGFNRGADTVTIRFRYTGPATNVTADNLYLSALGVTVRALRRDRSGAGIIGTTDYENPWVLAHQVVIDCLSRFVPRFDAETARIDSTTFQIEQLAFPDGIRFSELLDTLADFEPDHYAAAWEEQANGLYRFEYRRWDDANPTYVADLRDEISLPGGETDLCNRVTVYYKDRRGDSHSVLVLRDVPELGDRTRDADPIDLQEEAGGTEAMALRVGEQLLADKARSATSGTVTVSRPMIDVTTGRNLPPYMLRAGQTCMVSELSRQAPVILRVTGTEYENGVCTLTLGSPVPTEEDMAVRAWRRLTSKKVVGDGIKR